MYGFFSEISSWLSGPFGITARSSNIAFLAALFFGFAGSVAPCQLTANLGSITYFGNKYMQEKLTGMELVLYLIGKILVFPFLVCYFGYLAAISRAIRFPYLFMPARW
jgi:hypothetical protein